MNRVTFLLLAGIFWAIMTALLVQREILPYLEFQDPPSYRSFLRGIAEPEFTHQKIYMSGKEVGEIETLIVPRADGTFEIRSWARFEMPDLPAPIPDKNVYSASRTEIDRSYLMSRQISRTQVLGLSMTAQAQRTGEKMRLTVDVPLLGKPKVYDNLDFAKDEMLADPFVPYFGGKLSVGKKWKAKTLDVTSVSPSTDLSKIGANDLYATVEERKRIRYQGKEVDCYEVVFRKRPTPDEDAISHIVYVNDSGVVIQTTLFLGKFVYNICLLDKRSISADQASTWKTSIEFPPGFKQP